MFRGTLFMPYSIRDCFDTIQKRIIADVNALPEADCVTIDSTGVPPNSSGRQDQMRGARGDVRVSSPSSPFRLPRMIPEN